MSSVPGSFIEVVGQRTVRREITWQPFYSSLGQDNRPESRSLHCEPAGSSLTLASQKGYLQREKAKGRGAPSPAREKGKLR